MATNNTNIRSAVPLTRGSRLITADWRIVIILSTGMLRITDIVKSDVNDQGVSALGKSGAISIGSKFVITRTMARSSKSVTGWTDAL